MGLFSSIVSGIGSAISKVKSFFSSSSGSAVSSAVASYAGGSSSSHTYTTTTTYDPDRVKAAQVDKERAEIENERIELMRRAQLDIIEAQKESRIAQEQARAEGFMRISEAITAMQEKLDELAQRRLAIIEGGTLQAVREAEEFYAELTAEIKRDNDLYTAEKLPALLEILGRYEEGSPAHNLYMKKIEEDIALQAMHTTRQLESAMKRQDRIIDGIMTAKNEIMTQTGNITAGILDTLREKISELDTGNIQLQGTKEIPALPV
ncbi:MAG: hypothetical protein IJQ58_10055 [Synergistaceae bacterium]|nr:hypothetical protein [Synergistaceae bacterium]